MHLDTHMGCLAPEDNDLAKHLFFASKTGEINFLCNKNFVNVQIV